MKSQEVWLKSLSGREGPSPARRVVSSMSSWRAAEEHLGLNDTAGLLLSIYSSTKDASSGFPSYSNTSTLLEWGYLQIYIFKRKRRIKHFIFCGKQDKRKIDPTKILFFLTENSKCLLFWYESVAEKVAQVPVWLSEPPLGTAQIKCPTASDMLWDVGVFSETSMSKKLLQKDELYHTAQPQLPRQNRI